MKIFIEVPRWLGDCVMTTPAIENIISSYPKAKLIIFGSFVSTRIFANHPNVDRLIVDNSRGGGRYLNLYRYAKEVGKVDLALSFRRNFSTKFLLFFIDSPQKHYYKRYTKKILHQVIRYNDFINKSLSKETTPQNLKIYLKKEIPKPSKPLLGINAGATYGSAKRWYPQEFAKVAISLSNTYDIILFGGDLEVDIIDDIEDILIENQITNYQNLAGKTSVDELIEKISTLSLFITNDSGPMHIAGAFSIPTISIFGPTKYKETNQWQNPNETIIRKELDCSPCMKRVCPLSHHNCMKEIMASDVLGRV